ncbi:MAG: hypothetical protein AMXMBFR7_33280 [Planctomycetota bacterium]
MGVEHLEGVAIRAAATPRERPRLLAFFHFSLRFYLGVVLLAAVAGLLGHLALEFAGQMVRDQQIRSGDAQTREEVRRFEQSKNLRLAEAQPDDYAEAVANWYANRKTYYALSIDSVELVMRGARTVDAAKFKNQIERLNDYRVKGDRVRAYEVPGPRGTASYVFLIQNDVVVFSACKEPGDTSWVGLRSNAENRLVAEAPEWISGAALAISMLLVLLLAGGFVVALGTCRWLLALWSYYA